MIAFCTEAMLLESSAFTFMSMQLGGILPTFSGWVGGPRGAKFPVVLMYLRLYLRFIIMVIVL